MGKWDRFILVKTIADDEVIVSCDLCNQQFTGDIHGAKSACGNHIGQTHFPMWLRTTDKNWEKHPREVTCEQLPKVTQP